MKLHHQLTPYTKINSRWIKDLNVSHDTIKVLKERTQAGRFEIFPAAIFSPICPLVQDIKERINKWHFIKIKNFCTAIENISKMKREPTVWENIFANDNLDKGLISKIYKELSRLHSRKTNHPIKK